MDAIRCDISAYTASFRLPGVMGYQATASVPPPAMVFGLLSAAAGRDVVPDELEWLAYRFSSSGTAVDLEKIIVFGERGPFHDDKLGGINTVPIKREFLYDARLVIYIPRHTFEDALMRPRYPIYLGRSQDVAAVDKLVETHLEHVEEATVKGVLIPFPAAGKAPESVILSMPTCMQAVLPRTPRYVRLFHVVSKPTVANNVYLEAGERLAVPLLKRETLLSGNTDAG